MSVSDPPRLKTVGIVAAICGVSIRRVEYVLRSRPHIQPAALAGTARLIDARAIAMVRHELNAIDARRSARKGVSEWLLLNFEEDADACGLAQDGTPSGSHRASE